MELEEIRKKIDDLDAEFIKLLAKRQLFMKEIAEYKKAHNLPLHQPERERHILEAKTKLAEAAGIDPKLVHSLFMAIFKNSKEIQSNQ